MGEKTQLVVQRKDGQCQTKQVVIVYAGKYFERRVLLGIDVAEYQQLTGQMPDSPELEHPVSEPYGPVPA